MKTENVTINKTADRPEGVEVELVHPESELEQGVLAHLLAGFMRDAVASGRVDYNLPEDVRFEYTRNGSFVAMGRPADAPADGMYVPRQPVAIAGIARFGKRFDVIHAALANQPQAQPATARGGEAKADAPAPDTAIGDEAEVASANPPEADDEAGDETGRD